LMSLGLLMATEIVLTAWIRHWISTQVLLQISLPDITEPMKLFLAYYYVPGAADHGHTNCTDSWDPSFILYLSSSKMRNLPVFILRKALWKYITRGQEKKSQEDNGLTYIKTMDVLKSMVVHCLVEAVCCDKVEEPTLHLYNTKSPPKFIPLKCTHGIGGDPLRKCQS
jgi:hypothetical protein